ncbi:MAG TPA: aspartate 1-decarboxylase [Myxococcota bacterium]|nr:aspartate 1-decarboxylase [Myxococcota bacterium]HOD06497.1 aspartate 1-decarboxylase [Myxococcota bacterium]HPB49901.1 aspartate 1-decarboxylase [Myxococcota bacterium]HQP94960.1 aspartate 1-decarboxylase [Myxococcota bacterium]
MLSRRFLRAKIHRATVTDADVDYVGSITIDRDLLDAAGVKPLEEVEVWNVTNGARFSTYCIPGERGSGTVQINGAAAHLAQAGDKVIIAAWIQIDSTDLGSLVVPVVVPDEDNAVFKRLEYRVDLGSGSFDVVEL